MISIAFVKFLDAKDKPSGKTYVYLVDDSIRNALEPSSISNRVNTYYITNNSGYNYRGAKIVCVGVNVLSDEKCFDLTNLKQIITANYAGEIDYPKSDRIQDWSKAQNDFDKERKKTTDNGSTSRESFAFIKFLDSNNRFIDKIHTFLVDDWVRWDNRITNTDYVKTYHITSKSGNNYNNAKAVFVGTFCCDDACYYYYSDLEKITTATACGEIYYPESTRKAEFRLAFDDFGMNRRKVGEENISAIEKTIEKNTATTATISSTSNNKMKPCIKQDGIWQELFKPFELSFTTNNETLDNSLWKILDSAPLTGKIADVGTTTGKLSGVITNTIPNTLTTGASLKLNNLSKINIEEKKEKTMFEGMLKNLRFGKADNVKMSIYGPAIREGVSGDTWIAFDKSKEQWVDVPYEVVLDIPLFEMPVAKDSIQIGDFIYHAGIGVGWVRVIDFDDEVNYFIEAEDPSNHEIIKILPTRNMFGFDFYTKLIVPFDMGSTFGGASASNPFGMLPMLMMMSDKSKSKSDSDNNSMLMAMMMMQNGGMDFASNPMMLYALMGDKGGDNSMLMAMLMSQMMQGALTKHTCNCDHE